MEKVRERWRKVGKVSWDLGFRSVENHGNPGVVKIEKGMAVAKSNAIVAASAAGGQSLNSIDVQAIFLRMKQGIQIRFVKTLVARVRAHVIVHLQS